MTVFKATVINAAGRHRQNDGTTTRGQGPTNNPPAPREFAQSAPPASGVLDTGTPISAALDEALAREAALQAEVASHALAEFLEARPQ